MRTNFIKTQLAYAGSAFIITTKLKYLDGKLSKKDMLVINGKATHSSKEDEQ